MKDIIIPDNWTTRTNINSYIKDFNSLGLIGLDRFIYVNDRFGHIVGDEMIQDFIDEIDKEFKNEKINVKLCRFGGDTIMFLAQSYAKDILKFSENLIKHLDTFLNNKIKTYAVGDYKDALDFKMSASLGLASYENFELDNIFVVADKNMYKAKIEGGNRVIHSTIAS